MSEGSGRDRRNLFRIDYPIGSWAQLVIQKQIHKVLDLSEQHIRIETGPTVEKIPTPFTGSLVLLTKVKLSVEGVVITVRGDHVVLKLNKAVPFFELVKEQALLKKTKT